MNTISERATDRFTYRGGSDGCDHTWDICYPDGSFLVGIHYWEAADETEAEARLIVNALNAYRGRA